MFSRIPIGNLIIGVVAFVVFVYEGWRQMHRAKHVDRLERESLDFHRRVREGYLRLAERWPSRFTVLDATEPAEILLGRWQLADADFLQAVMRWPLDDSPAN